jgi:competence protein ComEA
MNRGFSSASFLLAVGTVSFALSLAGPAHAQSDAGMTPLLDLSGTPLRISPRLELGTATREQLIALPSIGPARADAILRLRERNRLRRVRDLRRIRGIGPRTLRLLRPLVRVQPPRPSVSR